MHEWHKTRLAAGPPYELATAPIECPECIAEVRAKRAAMCEKYGWDSWPDALNKGRDYIPMED